MRSQRLMGSHQSPVQVTLSTNILHHQDQKRVTLERLRLQDAIPFLVIKLRAGRSRAHLFGTSPSAKELRAFNIIHRRYFFLFTVDVIILVLRKPWSAWQESPNVTPLTADVR